MIKYSDPVTKQDIDDLKASAKGNIASLQENLDVKFNNITNMLDEVMGELKTVREGQAILSSQHGRILDLEEKTEKLEMIHPKFQHSPV